MKNISFKLGGVETLHKFGVVFLQQLLGATVVLYSEEKFTGGLASGDIHGGAFRIGIQLLKIKLAKGATSYSCVNWNRTPGV